MPSAEEEGYSLGQYLIEPRQFNLQSKLVSSPGPGEVLIEPQAVTLCGSDIHYYQTRCNGFIQA